MDVVIGDGQKVVSELRVLVDDRLRFVLAVAVGRVRVQVAAQPLTFGQISVRMFDRWHGGPPDVLMLADEWQIRP
jgi:hypothetical protein